MNGLMDGKSWYMWCYILILICLVVVWQEAVERNNCGEGPSPAKKWNTICSGPQSKATHIGRVVICSRPRNRTTEGLDSFSPREKGLVLLPSFSSKLLIKCQGLWSHGKWGMLTMRLYSLTGEEPHRYITSTTWKHGEMLKLFLWWAWFRREISSGRRCHVPPFS